MPANDNAPGHSENCDGECTAIELNASFDPDAGLPVITIRVDAMRSPITGDLCIEMDTAGFADAEDVVVMLQATIDALVAGEQVERDPAND